MGFDAPCCHTMVVDKPMAGHKERRYLIRRAHGMPLPGRQTAFHWLTMGFGDSEIAAP